MWNNRILRNIYLKIKKYLQVNIFIRMLQRAKAYGLRIANPKNKQSRHNKKKRKTLRSIKYSFVDAPKEKVGEESYEIRQF